ncbi:hypothetical protein FAZ69_19550 [Trinickia terrae]|uniref:Uncharacterized protein n=1 Tax=Trinickia terrae TaxID=2571161 RepID=A0A4U1I122_9BURK|nr:hypothetical protein [Trinickia terrae]TKC86837.1 hypothetical protein FAZ69_19550 [Trinickia terrae]
MELKAQTFARSRQSGWTDELLADAFAGEAACDAAEDALTHSGAYPLEQMQQALGAYDRAALAVLRRHRELRVEPLPVVGPRATAADTLLSLYINANGRLHIRPASQPKIDCEGGAWIDLGQVVASAPVMAEIDGVHAAWRRSEAEYFAQVRAAMDRLRREGGLPRAVEQVIGQLDYVESLSFYVGDRHVTLVDDAGRPTLLYALREKPYERWSDDDVLIVAALHVLMRSGRAACFDEFNGALLTARDLISRIDHCSHSDAAHASGVHYAFESLDLFERVAKLRELKRL